jgi:hypothetical protein
MMFAIKLTVTLIFFKIILLLIFEIILTLISREVKISQERAEEIIKKMNENISNENEIL